MFIRIGIFISLLRYMCNKYFFFFFFVILLYLYVYNFVTRCICQLDHPYPISVRIYEIFSIILILSFEILEMDDCEIGISPLGRVIH